MSRYPHPSDRSDRIASTAIPIRTNSLSLASFLASLIPPLLRLSILSLSSRSRFSMRRFC